MTYTFPFIVKLRDDFAGQPKPGRQKGREYIVLASDDIISKLEFVNDFKELDYIDRQDVRFIRFYNEVHEGKINEPVIEGELKLSIGVKGEITKQIKAVFEDFKNKDK